MIYVTSDIHGRIDRLKKLMKELRSDDKLIVLGDLVDRGNEPIEVIEFVMKQPNIEVIMGNHDEMMLHSLKYKDEVQIERWNRNGNQTTLDGFNLRSLKEQKKILEYIEGLPYFKIINNKFLLIHAGFDPIKLYMDMKTMPLEESLIKQMDRLVWERELFFMNKGLNGIITIFGHTPVPYINRCFGNPDKQPYEIWIDDRYNDKIGIDTANCYNGRLACLRLEDMKVFYIE